MFNAYTTMGLFYLSTEIWVYSYELVLSSATAYK